MILLRCALVLFGLITIVAASEYQFLEMYGNLTMGWYFVNLYFGNPPQIQSLFPDTGSSLTVFPCKQCLSCRKEKRHKLFDRQSSFTNKNSDKSIACEQGCQNWKETDICPFQITYGDNTQFKGEIYEDTIRFAIENEQKGDGFTSRFGCITDQENSYYTLTQNGILGLSHNRENIFHPWMKKLDSKKRKFGFCYARNGGQIQLGDVEVPKQNYFKTSIESNYFYSMKKTEMMLLGSKQIKMAEDGRQIMIDTGSTFTYFFEPIFRQMVAIISEKCGSSKCYRITQKSYSSSNHENVTAFFIHEQIWSKIDSIFPHLQIHIDNQTLIWKPSGYMRKLSEYFPRSTQQIYFLGMRPTQGRINILGIHWLQDRRLVLDIGGGFIYIQQPFDCSNNFYLKQQPSLAWYSFIEAKFTSQMFFLSIIVAVLLIGLFVRFKTCLLNRFRKKDNQGANENKKLIGSSAANKESESQIVEAVGSQELKEVQCDSSKVAPQIGNQMGIQQS